MDLMGQTVDVAPHSFLSPGNGMESKQTLREKLKTRRAAVSDQDREMVGKLIAEQFLQAVKIPEDTIIAVYWPMEGELDTRALLHELHKKGHVVVLPTVENNDSPLVFRKWTPEVEMVEGAHGTLEPPKDCEVGLPELVVAPLLGVDDTGHRLGYGGGYYDRTVEALRAEGAIFGYMGLCYSFQNVAELPAENHDQLLDAVMSEKGVYSFKKEAA